VKVLVIGGSGFTGRRVLTQRPAGAEVFATHRSETARRVIEAEGARPVAADLDDLHSLELAVKQLEPSHVIVLASLGFGHGPGLVESLEGAGSPRTVFTSTTGIFTSLNPASKSVRVAAEASITESSLPFTIVRPTMIYGRPGDRNMERLLRWLQRVPVVPAPNGGRNLQQPVHVDDLAAAIWSAAKSPAALGLAINVPGPKPLEFREIVAQAGSAVDRKARVLPVPVGPLRSAVGLQERLLATPRLKAEQIDRLVEDKVFSVDDARAQLGHDPRPFAEGIRSEAGMLDGQPTGEAA
jgi:nucleoside-diphosphate-sugar epimerase